MSANIAFCPYCGKLALPGASFCAYCGRELSVSHGPDDFGDRVIAPPVREELSGSCRIMFAGNDEMDVRSVGRLAAKATGLPLPDLTRRMRTTKGFIAAELDAEDAVLLAERIEVELGLSVMVIAEEGCAPLPAVMRMRRIRIQPEGLSCEIYTWDQTEDLSVSWNDVFMVSCGRLAFERVSEKETNGRRRAAAFGGNVPELVTERYHEFLVDIILYNPWRRLRLDYNTAGYAFKGDELNSGAALQALRKCAKQLFYYGRTVPLNPGVSCLAVNAMDSEWEQMTFLSKLDFDSYTHWLMQRIRFGCGMPS